MYMGIHVLPGTSDYWSSFPELRLDTVANIMPSKRFFKILQCLHCNDNTKVVPRGAVGYDKLHKLRPLIDSLNVSFMNTYEPANVQSIDEKMVKFKGRSVMKQYMPLKPIKRGYKIWIRADATNGYCCEFQVYTGKKEGSEEGLGMRVVKDLSQNVNEGVLLVFEKFFTSYELMEYL